MAKDDTIYVTSNGPARLKPVKLLKGEMRVLTVNVTPHLGNKSTTGSSVTWTSDDDGVVSIADASLADGVATVSATGAETGKTTLKAAVTLANEEILIRKFVVTVTDPLLGDSDAYA